MTTYSKSETHISVLGADWTVKIIDEDSETRFEKLNCDGFCDFSVREMAVTAYKKDKDWSVKDPKAAIRHAIAHELVHAFMYESGLANDWEHKNEFGQEETVVDWIAWQYQKITDTLNDIFSRLPEEEIKEE